MVYSGRGLTYIRTLMKGMGIEGLCRKPTTSKKQLGHKRYSYLLQNLVIDWAGFGYDVYSHQAVNEKISVRDALLKAGDFQLIDNLVSVLFCVKPGLS